MPISQSALNRGRSAAEADMRDQCRITKPQGERVWDDEKLQYVTGPPAVVYEGRCKLVFGSVGHRSAVAADQVFIEETGKLSLPVNGTVAVAVNQIVTVLASETDPDMVGAIFKISARRLRTNPTSRRFQIEETQ